MGEETKLLVPIRKKNGTYSVLELPPEEMDWPVLRAIWAQNAITMPLCFAPPEEKLETFFFYACQAYGAPSTLGTVFDPRMTDLYLEAGGHDCLVTSATLVKYFVENALFEDRLKALKQLVIVGTVETGEPEVLRAQCPELVSVIAHPAEALMVSK